MADLVVGVAGEKESVAVWGRCGVKPVTGPRQEYTNVRAHAGM